MKKLLISMLALIVVIGSITGFAQTFIDVPTDEWYAPYVDRLTSLGGINGYEDCTFRPENTMTNAEFTKTVIALTAGKEELGTVHWADNYMQKAVELGVLDEDEVPVSEYDEPIKRQRMAKIIAKTMTNVMHEEEIKDVSGYITKIADWDTTCELCKPYIAQVYAKGIINGYEDGTFGGSKTTTRAEATTMITRMLDKSYRVDNSSNGSSSGGKKEDDFIEPIIKMTFRTCEGDGKLFRIVLENSKKFAGEYETKVEFITPTEFNTMESPALIYAEDPWVISKTCGTWKGIGNIDNKSLCEIFAKYYTTRENMKTFIPYEGMEITYKVSIKKISTGEVREYTYTDYLQLPFGLKK